MPVNCVVMEVYIRMLQVLVAVVHPPSMNRQQNAVDMTRPSLHTLKAGFWIWMIISVNDNAKRNMPS